MIRPRALALTLLVVAVTAVASPAAAQSARLERITPILAVQTIEPSIPFWTALGFQPTSPADQDGKLVFMAFAKDGLQIHYQTIERIERDAPGTAAMLAGSTSLIYLTVSDLQAIVDALPADTEIVIPRRQTPWGADEIYVREPGGHLIAFAQFGRN
ncbi:MAG: VOC family protein [Acidobacteriota bacterium]|jgi:hypothetical protein